MEERLVYCHSLSDEEKLTYYRSLNDEEFINMPREQFNEYMALLREASNRSFHEYLANMKNEDDAVVLHESECDIHVDALNEDHIYNCAYYMDFQELVEEYSSSRVIEMYLLSGSHVLANSFFASYIWSVNTILERVIAERVVFDSTSNAADQTVTAGYARARSAARHAPSVSCGKPDYVKSRG